MADRVNEKELEIREEDDAVVFRVFVLPKSSRNQISGEHDGALKVKLTAPPVENAANKLCVTYLAKCLGLPKSSLEVAAGHTGRNKQIRVLCASSPEVKAHIRKKILALSGSTS